ncbi:hypothetical protein H6B11_13110 [Mediterraneibacter glycyrrhizinilyticus]|nr:DUF6070 family protein [Mediterraneibacter glycyrrhizinilyticus]MBM6855077.1 hypothetical protein [Mediterraneibacter glycyrrhizinilyticus]
MYMRKMVVKCMAFAAAAFLMAGCAENTESQRQSEEKEEAVEKGYGIPVDDGKKADAQEDCAEMFQRIDEVCPEFMQDERLSLTEEEAQRAADAMGASGNPVSGTDVYRGMENYESMEEFLRDCEAGKEGGIVLYELYDDGEIGRKEFSCDGEDVYLFAVSAYRKEGGAVLGDVSYSRIKTWSYTEKGWFFYELCAPEYPEVTEPIYSNAMMRVIPLKEEYVEITERFLEPIAYNGNNLFCTDWDKDHMQGIDYNGLFEYLYQVKTGDAFDKTRYENGIPGEEFENLMTVCLPVSAEQLREYASYESGEERYDWISLGVGNRTLGELTGSIPEVVDLEENSDGTLTLTVDAVCESMADDEFLTHRLTVSLDGDGSVRYLSNQVEEEKKDALSEYVYRIQKK